LAATEKKQGALLWIYTNNLLRRLKEHSQEDKNRELIYYEVYCAETDARKREQKLKAYWRANSSKAAN
jgi:predicted GIY-YIG superfamily endonuclease